MKMFKASSGFIFSFGWDMLARKEDPRLVCWCDPNGDWAVIPNNLAGSIRFSDAVDPEFIFEANDTIVAYQPGRCLEFSYVGGPCVWSASFMFPEKTRAIAA